RTVARSVARLTLAASTPSTFSSAFSTRRTQAAQVIPSTSRRSSSVDSGRFLVTIFDCPRAWPGATGRFSHRRLYPSGVFGQVRCVHGLPVDAGIVTAIVAGRLLRFL